MYLTKQEIEADIASQTKTHEILIAEMGIKSDGLSVETYLEWLVPYLRSFEGLSFEIEAFGGGDSGEINHIEAENLPEELTFYKFEYRKELGERTGQSAEKYGKYYSTRIWSQKCVTEKVTKSGKEALEDLFYSLTSLSGVDWYNNEGGTVEFQLSKDHLVFKIAQYVIEEHTAVDIAIDLREA